MDINKSLNTDSFPPTTDKLNFVDHISKFIGLGVSQLYLLCALITCYEVISRYVFDAPTQWAFETVMVLNNSQFCYFGVLKTFEMFKSS